MKNSRNVFWLLTLTLIAIPGFAVEELDKVNLDPADKPGLAGFPAGFKMHWLKDGKEHSSTLLSIDGNEEKGTWENSDGCKWSSLSYGWAPSYEWENCSGSTGTQSITKAKSSPWPMKVKTKFSYRYNGKDSKGNTWNSQRSCKVKSSVRVSVPIGEYDTFKIVCSDKWNTRTYWYSPELGHSVAIKRKHKNDNSRSFEMLLVKTVTPD